MLKTLSVFMAVEEVFEKVFRVDGRLATENLVKGKKVYGEELLREKGTEYRAWNPYRSKLAAAIMKGMKNMRIKAGSKVLYLGAATGTTSSHISDIVGEDGAVYCIEISERSMRDLFKVVETRSNMLPILADARNVDAYAKEAGRVDIIYEDVSARDQDEILLRNSELLKAGGFAYVAIKSQSIDVASRPKEVYDRFLTRVSEKFEIIEQINITPYDKMHLFVVLKKKK